MVDKLTKEQEAQMSVYAKKWIDRYTSGLVYADNARKQIEWLYSLCEIKKPEIYLVDSPIAAQVVANMIGHNDKLVDLLTKNAWKSIDKDVPIWGDISEVEWGSQIKKKMEYHSYSSYGNISDYGWVAYYDYFFNCVGVKNDNPNFDSFMELIDSGVYDMIQFDTACIAVSLPVFTKKDNNKRLHSDTGPAVKFRDGYSQWYWKGVFVPRHWIENPETITAKELSDGYKNAEMRRVLIDILGVKDFYHKLGVNELTVIDTDTDNQGNPMTLYSFPFFWDTVRPDGKVTVGRKIQMLECVCPSSKRVYNIAPPNQECRNVWDAKASICQVTERDARNLKLES